MEKVEALTDVTLRPVGEAEAGAPKGEGKLRLRLEEGDRRALEDVVHRLNFMLEVTYYDLRFRIHEATHDIIVQVVNRETGEVVREIPPKRILDMVAEMMRLVGILFEERV
ncbi:flagellar protein FlaG protein [Ammonifex degensii KC4]|uniref:Flagellar protein FlaG protein n=1 Tax=Ammonifex degensii (strain DSM 10501 / KC4) TaxID=429009 RepID=C9RAZ5_AMMDK|nr:flagellar protein FlaG protein [Ammonifex degensii KC4]